MIILDSLISFGDKIFMCSVSTAQSHIFYKWVVDRLSKTFKHFIDLKTLS